MPLSLLLYTPNQIGHLNDLQKTLFFLNDLSTTFPTTCPPHRQLPVPVLIRKGWVLGQLPLDHERLDVIDRVDVLDAVLHDPSERLEALVGAHGRYGIACRRDVGCE